MKTFAAPPPTAYGWHLRCLLRAVDESAGHILYPQERFLIAAQEVVELPALDRLARLLARRTADTWVDDIIGSDARILQHLGWCVADASSRVRATRHGRTLWTLAQALADPVSGNDATVAVTCGLDGRPLPDLPLGRSLYGIDANCDPSPWPDRHALEGWLTARQERGQAIDESAWMRALAQVAGSAASATPLLGYHCQAPYQWARRLQECTEHLPYDPRRLAACLRALRTAPAAPSLARWQAHNLYRMTTLRGWRRHIASQVASWRVWSSGEAQRWHLRASGQRRAQALPDVPVRYMDAWIDHDAAGMVVADGERVEMHALRRLRQEGWHGIHAEGGFWLGLVAQLAHRVILADLPQAWIAPWQSLPLDWGRWGFSARRKQHIDALVQQVMRQPEQLWARTLEETADYQFPGWPTFPDPAAAEQVMRCVPPLILARILRRLLQHPREASGLPDLLCWRGDAIALWEVKSPGDALSDQQRSWLTWCAQEGVSAGVIRLRARAHQQMSLLPEQASTAKVGSTPRRSTSHRGRRTRTRRPQARYPQLHLLDVQGKVWDVCAGAPVPGVHKVLWSQQAHAPVQAWSGTLGLGAMDGWQRPVERVQLISLQALRWSGIEGLPARRWIAMPQSMSLPLLISHEADPGGGVRTVATMLWRQAGWLVEAEACHNEPVIVDGASQRSLSEHEALDWAAHPSSPPPRPWMQAEVWGCRDDLQQQLDLVQGYPHALVHGDEHICVRIAQGSAYLWVNSHPRLIKGALPWSEANPSPP